MCGQLYLDTMRANRANLIMQYLSIRQIWKPSILSRPLEPQNHFYDMQ